MTVARLADIEIRRGCCCPRWPRRVSSHPASTPGCWGWDRKASWDRAMPSMFPALCPFLCRTQSRYCGWHWRRTDPVGIRQQHFVGMLLGRPAGYHFMRFQVDDGNLRRAPRLRRAGGADCPNSRHTGRRRGSLQFQPFGPAL